MNSDNRPIGIFDSGVGGLTVVSEVMKTLPNEEIVYFGDTARVPYGSKSKETVTKFSRQIIQFLITKNVKLIIIACNTASSNSHSILTREFELPIIEVVSPGVTDALKLNPKKVGIIGTEATVRSKAHENMLLEQNPKLEVFSKACPLFVPLAEEGWINNEVAQLTAKLYLEEFIQKEVDTILLGCTHYPLLKDCIRQTVGEKVNIVNPAVATAYKTKEFLEENNMVRKSYDLPQHNFYVSDNTKKFDVVCGMVLETGYQAQAQKVDMNFE